MLWFLSDIYSLLLKFYWLKMGRYLRGILYPLFFRYWEKIRIIRRSKKIFLTKRDHNFETKTVCDQTYRGNLYCFLSCETKILSPGHRLFAFFRFRQSSIEINFHVFVSTSDLPDEELFICITIDLLCSIIWMTIDLLCSVIWITIDLLCSIIWITIDLLCSIIWMTIDLLCSVIWMTIDLLCSIIWITIDLLCIRLDCMISRNQVFVNHLVSSAVVLDYT